MKSNFFSNIREFFVLLAVAIAVQCSSFIEFLRVVFRYYHNPKFRRIDFSLLLSYFLNSPFAISKEFLKQKRKKDLYAYGETPLTTLDLISKECRIKATDIVYELGCGRGRNCFWLNCFIQCKVVGIDYIPEFIERAQGIVKKFELSDVAFRLGDIAEADLSDATVIYLYGTCLEDSFIEKLVERFKNLPAGTKIITVSYPLTDYCKEPAFEVMKRFEARFPWGNADVYLNVVR